MTQPLPTLDEWLKASAPELDSFRYLADKGTLQLRFKTHPERVYDFPCDARLYRSFRTSKSQYQFVEDVLRPHAEKMGWTELAKAHRGASPAPADR